MAATILVVLVVAGLASSVELHVPIQYPTIQGAINDANDGDIAGFGENWWIATPSFARVWRETKATPPIPQEETL